ncbi:MAG: single-stranded DNA-binding protein [Azonexus sp.]
MSDLPFIVMTGGLVDDPELRFTPSGKAVIGFRLAGKKRVRDANGQWADGDPIYMNVTAWERVAENAAETIKRKGQRVTVTGRLEQQWWEKDGQKNSKYVIVADSVSVDLTFSAYDERAQTERKAATDDPWATGPAPAQVDEPPF